MHRKQQLPVDGYGLTNLLGIAANISLEKAISTHYDTLVIIVRRKRVWDEWMDGRKLHVLNLMCERQTQWV
jgi:hypothetical protein